MKGINSRAAGENMRSQAGSTFNLYMSGLIYRGRISDMKLENYYSLAHWAECTRPYSDAVTANESDVKTLTFLESRAAGICV